MNFDTLRLRLPKIAAALAIIACLLPVPVLALSFLGTWQFFESKSGTQLPPSHNHFSSDNPGVGGNLQIDMRQFTTTTDGKITVTATRDFALSRTELVNISHSFGSLLANGNISVTMSVVRIGAMDVFGWPPYSGNAGNGPPGVFGTNFNKSVALSAGNYRVSLTIIYNTGSLNNPGGQWNNTSIHNFNFSGV